MSESPNVSPPRSIISNPSLDLSWPVHARWGLLLAYGIAWAASGFGFVQAMDEAPLLAGAAATIATNLILPLLRKRIALQALTVLTLLLDVAILSVVLYATGGATNPLTALYIMPVALAAVMLPPRFAWTLAGLTITMFFLLFSSPESHDHHRAAHGHRIDRPSATPTVSDHGDHGHHDNHRRAERHGAHAEQPTDSAATGTRHSLDGTGAPDGRARLGTAQHGAAFDLHLRGMWMAFSLAAILTAYFVTRVSEALRRKQRQLEEAWLRAHRAERVASLGSLAASTAHELGTPLGSIALAASEMRTAIANGQPAERLAADADIVCSEVRRCREIIDAMVGAAGETIGESPSTVAPYALIAAAVAALPSPDRDRVHCEPERPLPDVRLPKQLISQTIQNLIRNGLEACDDNGKVEVSLKLSDATISYIVQDCGTGMSAQQLATATDPFVSTKDGRGRGMGLFFASSVAVRLGGELRLSSAAGRGTTAILDLPLVQS